MSHKMLKALAIAASLSIAGASQAAAATYVANLAGSNEVPPNFSPGSGVATVTITGNIMNLQVTFQNLLAPNLAAHIHCCTSPVAIVATPVPTFPGFPTGVTSGVYNNSFDLLQPTSYNPAFLIAHGGAPPVAMNALIAGLNSGNAYFNIHTPLFPGGEIRGNFSLVPEPGTWALMIAGFGLTGLAIRQRRKALAA